MFEAPRGSTLDYAGSGGFGGAESNSLIAALAAAARAAEDVTAGDGYNNEDEDVQPEVNPNLTPEGRLASLLEVNRLLHGALAEKKSLLEASKSEISRLTNVCDRRAVEEPARRDHIDELQSRIQVSEPVGRMGREVQSTLKQIQKMEGKIGILNEDNLVLSEKHRLERARMVEQQARLRTLGKRERELAKHVDYLANKLNDAVKTAHVQAQKNLSSAEEESADVRSLPADFKNISGSTEKPGLRLNKLIGKSLDKPPAGVVLGAAGSSIGSVSEGQPQPKNMQQQAAPKESQDSNTLQPVPPTS